MLTLHGIYYSLNNAQRNEALVELQPSGRLRLQVGDSNRTWSIDELEFSDVLGALPCSIIFPDGARFEAPDDPSIGEWLRQHGRQRGGAWVHRFERHWKWVATSFAVVITSIALFLWVGLPAASGWIAEQVPMAMRIEVGRQTMLVVDRLLGETSTADAWRAGRIERQFQALLALRPMPELRPRLQIRRGAQLGANALAIPDGTVIVTEELIEVAPDSAAILGVLAHELGHLHHNHAMEEVVRASSLPVLVVLLTGDLGSGTSLLGTIPIRLMLNGYSREAEREADAFALELMLEQNLEPGAMADFFAILQEESGTLPGWLSTHPDNAERILYFRNAAQAGRLQEISQ